MQILITGGGGFIGKNLKEYFYRKCKVLAPSHKELDLLDGDAVSDYFSSNKIDFVIHCAVKPGHRNADDPSGQLYHNTRMFFNLARNSQKFQKMIYLGSGLVYDLQHYEPKMTEDFFDRHLPEDEGGFSKYIISKYIENHPEVIELRVFGIFGKYEDYAIRFISNLICKALFDLPLTMNQNRKFDYIYIDDLYPVIEHFILNKPKKFNIFNITPDKSEELYQIAEKIKNISGKNLKIVKAKPGMGLEYSGSNVRLREEMPKVNFTQLDEAILDLYRWYQDHKSTIEVEKLKIDK